MLIAVQLDAAIIGQHKTSVLVNITAVQAKHAAPWKNFITESVSGMICS